MYIGWFHWDPSTDFLTLPVIGLPVTWYGLLFATGFWIGFHIFVFMFKRFLAARPLFIKGDVNFKELHKKYNAELSSLKSGDLDSCNSLLESRVVEKGASFSKENAKLIKEIKENLDEQEIKLLENRLSLEEKYPKIFTPLKMRARDFAEKLILYVIAATVIGSRVAHILFYQNPMHYLANPLMILKTWEGGLASHGGILAIIFSLWLFYRSSRKLYPDFSWFMLLDGIAIPTMLVASMIRIGNFVNQEILGVETGMPWGIVFEHPADGSLAVPRHPAQLYESIFYLGIFISLVFLWKRYNAKWEPGRFAGIAIFGSFFFRFFIEFIKTGQSVWYDQASSMLHMGQILSIPLAIIGMFLIVRKGRSLTTG